MTGLEIAANATMAVSILLAARNSVHTWWTGIVACALFGVLFRDAKLYADAVLQLFFIATSVYGWWHWKHGGGSAGATPVRRTTPRLLVAAVVAALLTTVAYGAILHRFTDAAAPLLDSAVLAFSVVAQWLLMHRRLETWPFWLLVNTIAVPLFASRGLMLTAALYSVYWFNAWFGWWYWRQQAGRT